jgi:hypothetical protein
VSNSRRIWVQDLPASRLARAKRAFSTRRADATAMRTLVGGSVRPRPGDLVLARITRLGQHRKLELTDGRRATLHLDDEVLVAYGDRYAPDQYEALVPDRLGPAHLVASGGIASVMISRSMDVRNATDISPVGLVGDSLGRPLNLAAFALPPMRPPGEKPPTLAVIGTSMNSGKTTTIHSLVHTLGRAGLKPGATKVTGTGSGGDYWVMVDAGAHVMLDFTDVGLASTYRQPMSVIDATFLDLLGHLTAAGSGVRLVEVADGIYQRETARLIESPSFRSEVDMVIFAAGDAMGAAAGVSHLRALDLQVVAVSGRLTKSPLAVREAQEATGLPVLGLAHLADAVVACGLLGVDVPERSLGPDARDYPATDGAEADGDIIDLVTTGSTDEAPDDALLAEEPAVLRVLDQR